MELTVTRTFLSSDENNTIGTARTIDGRSGTVFQNVERLDVVRVDVGQVAAGHSVNDNQRAGTSRTRGHTTDLDARLIVRVAGTRVGDAHAGNLALDHHGRVDARYTRKVLG